METTREPSSFKPHPGLLVALVGMAVAGGVMYWHQNHGAAIGGAISVPKIFWLFYALPAWFIVPIFLARDTRVAPALRRIYAWHLGWWWFRGAAELWLMYGLHAWKPPYGIGHDAIAIALVTGLLYRYRAEVATATNPASRNAHRYLWVIVASLVAEITFAYLFNQTVGGHTEALWFADDSARFTMINRLTTAVDLAAYTALFATVYGYFRSER